MLGLPVPQGYDIAQHVRFASSYQEALLNGVFVPSWAHFENLGFGSVGIRFYPPFADYILAVTQFFTGDWYDTFLINSFLWMFPGCIGVFFWVKEFRTSDTAFLAASLYAVMPYHLLQVYRMQLYSEFVASAILPFCFLFATRLIRRGNAVATIVFGFSCALLVLTHLPASLIGGMALAVYIGVMVDWRNPLPTLARFAAATAVTLTLASFYLVRLVSEIDWVKHSGSEFSTGFFDHRRHLFPIIYRFGEGYWEYPLWRLDVSIIVSVLLLLLLVIWIVKAKTIDPAYKCDRKNLIAIAITGMFSVFMLSAMSGFVWHMTSSLQKIQFPWRFLSVASLMASVSAACMMALISDRSWRFNRMLAFSAIVLIAGAILFDITKVIPIADRPSTQDFYEMSVDRRDSEGCECWWPKWANRNAFQSRELVSAGSRRVEIKTWEPASREFTIGEGEPVSLRVATFFYPYWRATINERSVVVEKDENGVIVLPLQNEVSHVRLYFEEPRYYQIASFLSVISWLGMIGVLIYSFLSRYWQSQPA